MPARSTARKNTISTRARTITADSDDGYNDVSDVSDVYRPPLKISVKHESSESDEEEYKHLNDIEHIIRCKGMYLGAYRNSEQNTYTATITPKLKLTKEKTIISTGLLKMFDELAMNAVDQISKSGRGKNKLTYIHFDVNNDGWFGCANDGKGIPIKLFSGDTRYIPEVLFTQPKSGSNFKDVKEGAGQNGIGIKLTTIMSSSVEIHVIDPSHDYIQTVTNNGQSISAPVITNVKGMHKNMVH